MGRKVELPVTGAPNARPKGKAKGKKGGKSRAEKMPTIGDDGGSPMFRLFLWVAVIASLAYAATRVEWRGKTVADHAAELIRWEDVKSKAVAWGSDAAKSVEQWTRTTPAKPAEPKVAAKAPEAPPKPVVAKAGEKPGLSAGACPECNRREVQDRAPGVKTTPKPASKPALAETQQHKGAAKPAVTPTPPAPKAIANNTPHEVISADERAALDRLMHR